MDHIIKKTSPIVFIFNRDNYHATPTYVPNTRPMHGVKEIELISAEGLLETTFGI